jgi:hypothetical protein
MEWSKRWQDRYLVEGEVGYKSPREAFLRHIYSERSCRSSDSGLHIFDGSTVIQIWLVICLGDGVDLSHWSEITAHMA